MESEIGTARALGEPTFNARTGIGPVVGVVVVVVAAVVVLGRREGKKSRRLCSTIGGPTCLHGETYLRIRNIRTATMAAVASSCFAIAPDAVVVGTDHAAAAQR
jgi:hypothetical protein